MVSRSRVGVTDVIGTRRLSLVLFVRFTGVLDKSRREVTRADVLFVTLRLVVCFGNPGEVSGFRAYSRPASLDVPTIRGDVLLCPLSDTVVAPVVVADARVGGDPSVLVVHTDEHLGGPVEQVAFMDPDWIPVKPAVALRGDVLGVFLDEDATDLMPVSSWPEWSASQTPLLVSLGIVSALPQITVDGLPDQQSLPFGITAAVAPVNIATVSNTDRDADVVSMHQFRTSRQTDQ